MALRCAIFICWRAFKDSLNWKPDVLEKHQLTILLLCLGVAVSFNSPAAQSLMDGKQKIHDCVAAARYAGLYPGRCVGVLADPCINSVAGKADAVNKAKECAAQELKIWAARLEKSLAAIKRADADISFIVWKAQKAWGSANDFCPVFDKVDPGAALGAAEYCRLQTTAARALLLEGLELSVSEP